MASPDSRLLTARVKALVRPSERLTAVAQTKLTPTESRELDELVAYLGSTRSSVVRAIVTLKLAEFRPELDAWKKHNQEKKI